jgi:hypothetical protein
VSCDHDAPGCDRVGSDPGERVARGDLARRCGIASCDGRRAYEDWIRVLHVPNSKRNPNTRQCLRELRCASEVCGGVYQHAAGEVLLL